MRKVRLFVWGDAVIATGFSRVLHSIIDNLPKDVYDISWLGVNYKGDPHSYPYRIYPAGMRGDPYGLTRLDDILRIEKPDVIFALNDPWVVDPFLEELSKIYKDGVHPPVILYFPTDAKEHNPEWYKRFDKTFPIVYTRFGREVAQKARPDLKYSIIPHGVDFNTFYQMDKQEARKLVFKDKYEDLKDSFIFLNANRNQPRKRLDITIKAFAEFCKGKDDAYLWLHSGPIDSFINTFELVKRYGLEKKVLYTTSNSGPSQSTVEYLNQLYNATDVGINTGLGEGWGLCLYENTPIWTKQGIFKIRDVEPGMEVLSHTGNYRKVLRKVFTGKKKLVKVNLGYNRYIVASDEHKFMTPSGWKEVKELVGGDSIQLAKPILKQEDLIVDFAKDNRLFCDEDRVWFKERTGFPVTYRRFVNITKELSEAIGYYLAKGKIVDNTVIIRTRTEDKALSIMNSLKVLGVDSTVTYDTRTRNPIVKFKDPLYVDFFRQNFGPKLRSKTVPDAYFSYSLPEMVRAYVEYRYKSSQRKIFFYSFSDKLSSFLTFQFHAMNIPVTVKLRGNSHGAYCEFTRSIRETNLPIKSNRVFEPSVPEDQCYYWRVVSKEVTEELDSYDLEVDVDHSYVANGLVVHNCNVEHAVTGAPQIVPKHSACKELFDTCGLLIDPIMDFTLTDIGTEGGLVHPSTVAKAMNAIYSDKKLYKTLSERGIAEFKVKELSWPYLATIWNEIFLGAVNIPDDNVPNEHKDDN